MLFFDSDAFCRRLSLAAGCSNAFEAINELKAYFARRKSNRIQFRSTKLESTNLLQFILAIMVSDCAQLTAYRRASIKAITMATMPDRKLNKVKN